MLATANCPKCQRLIELPACGNCGGLEFHRGPLTDGSTGMICDRCNMGFSCISCPFECGALVPATAFGTPVSRVAEGMRRNLDAAQGGPCFLATELYGSDSSEVATLRLLRDQVLLKTRPGRRFVKLYYRMAPAVLPVLRRSGPLRLLLRSSIACLVLGLRLRHLKIFGKP